MPIDPVFTGPFERTAHALPTAARMKFQPDRAEGVNLIVQHEPGGLRVGGQWHRGSVIVPWHGPVSTWRPQAFAGLLASDADALLALQPELVIFGSGAVLRFAHPSLWRGLIDARIGVETMDTAAACRTYNVLVSEGRRAVAALLDSSISTG